MSKMPQTAVNRCYPSRRSGFTLVELLVVIAIVGVLSSILLPALAKSKARAQGINCLSNTKQLALGWVLYADDHAGTLPYNLGTANAALMNFNWANNVLDWKLSPDNTNAAALIASGIGPYTGKSTAVYLCPSDYVVSSVQANAGWDHRVRSYSMNAMLGDGGNATKAGYNANNREYVQFFKYSAIPRPADIFVFVDEHPDSIDDGAFENRADDLHWQNLPASYHNGAAAFSFADGHSEMHRWHRSITKPPPLPKAAHLPIALASRDDLQDFLWIISAMSVAQPTDSYHY